MKFSLCVEMLYQKLAFHERLYASSRDGFDYCEFWRWKDKKWDLLAKAIGDSGIKISAFSGDDEYSPIDYEEKDPYLKFLDESISKALSIDCHNLIIHSDALNPDNGSAKKVKTLSRDQKLINLYDVLKEAAQRAEKKGITFLLEPLNTRHDHENYFLSDPDRAFELIEAVKSVHVKLLFDIYHMQIMKGDVIHRIQKNIDKIGYIHVADVPGRHEPGTGELNYKNIFKSINETNYTGFIGFELSPRGDNKSAIEAIKKSIDSV